MKLYNNCILNSALTKFILISKSLTLNTCCAEKREPVFCNNILRNDRPVTMHCKHQQLQTEWHETQTRPAQGSAVVKPNGTRLGRFLFDEMSSKFLLCPAFIALLQNIAYIIQRPHATQWQAVPGKGCPPAYKNPVYRYWHAQNIYTNNNAFIWIVCEWTEKLLRSRRSVQH